MTIAVVAGLGYASRFGALGDEAKKPAEDVLYRWDTAVYQLIQYGFFLAVVLAISSASRWRLGLRRPRSWPSALGLAAGVFVGSYVILGLLDHYVLHGGEEQGLTPDRWEPKHAGAFAANFVVIAVVAPIVEELLFRGIGFHLLERYGDWAAILVVGLAFGLYHGLVNALPLLAALGAALAWLRARTGSVYPGMLVHAAFNGIALLLAVTTSSV